MKCEWKEVKLGEIATVKGGKRLPKGSNLSTEKNAHPYIRVRDLGNHKTINLTQAFQYVDDETFKTISRYTVDENDIVISIVGTIGLVGIVDSSLHKASLTENCVKIINLKDVDKVFLYYFLVSDLGQTEISKGTVGAVQAKLPIKNIQSIELSIPPLTQQQKIASILSALDDKIELNNKINENLEQQAQAIFKSWFVDFEPWGGVCPEDWETDKAENFFDITIGKTPPRKEPWWFSENPNDVVWVSISDMGNCGMFISDSSEYLTQESIEKFNVKVVPTNTVLLSFKLTVGRVAICDGEMCTNEAIAHFKSTRTEDVEYLYCYLKAFNYQTMGSTSSIATAVNSKIIKAMPVLMPSIEHLESFHDIVAPIFSEIKENQKQTKNLSLLRDTLLPKLMSGEIDVSEIEI